MLSCSRWSSWRSSSNERFSASPAHVSSIAARAASTSTRSSSAALCAASRSRRASVRRSESDVLLASAASSRTDRSLSTGMCVCSSSISRVSCASRSADLLFSARSCSSTVWYLAYISVRPMSGCAGPLGLSRCRFAAGSEDASEGAGIPLSFWISSRSRLRSLAAAPSSRRQRASASWSARRAARPRRTSSGSLVVGAGICRWCWGETQHTSSARHALHTAASRDTPKVTVSRACGCELNVKVSSCEGDQRKPDRGIWRAQSMGESLT